MTSFALGIWQDLREKRLWPVAVLLVVALLAVPVMLRKPAEDIPVAAVGATTGATTADGLPSPETVLEGGGKPLVTLAVLRSPSDLERFDVKNPFKPLRELDGQGAGDTADGSGDAPSSIGDIISDLGGAGGDTGGGTVDGGGGIPAPDGGGTPVPPSSDPGDGGDGQSLTYSADVTFDGPTSPERRYRNLPRLSMLPSTSNPRLVYLGVNGSGNGAVFLVDSTLQAGEGEGTCAPSGDDCATITLEPGEQRYFTDDQDRRYFLRVDQIRVRPIASSSSTDSEAQAGRASVDGKASIRRFLPPVITDVLAPGVQR